MRDGLLKGLCLAVWVSLPALAAPNPDLDKATRLLADLQYADASTALDAAAKRAGNDRETVLRILELQGVVAATLNQGPKASKAFQAMLSIDPERKLTGDYPPRVMTPYYEARGRVGDVGRLEVKMLPATKNADQTTALNVEVNDPVKLVKRVRFHLKADGGAWLESAVDLTAKTASVSTSGSRVEWWAELLGERDSVLGSAGSETTPFKEGAQSDPVAADVPRPVDVTPVVAAPPPQVAQTPSAPMKPARVASFVLLGAGVVSAGVGVYFGVTANSLKTKVDSAATDAQGHVTGLTQKEAMDLDAQQRSAATAANISYAVGGALVATGVVCFILGGGDDGAKVAVTPMGNGLMLSGTLP